MKIAIAADAWHLRINDVVGTPGRTAIRLKGPGARPWKTDGVMADQDAGRRPAIPSSLSRGFKRDSSTV